MRIVAPGEAARAKPVGRSSTITAPYPAVASVEPVAPVKVQSPPSQPAQPLPPPPAAGNPEVVTLSTADVADAVDEFARELGGRDALLAVFSVAAVEPDQHVEHFIDALNNPKYAHLGVRRLCQASGLSAVDLFAAYQKAVIARAHIQSAHIVGHHLPPIVEDVMKRAAPQDRICHSCLGKGLRVHPKGYEGPPEACIECWGKGRVQTEPDLDRQKIALELGQLLEKKGGIFMQQNTYAAGGTTNILATAGGGALEQLQQAVGDLLFSPTRRRIQAPKPADDPTPEPVPQREIDVPLPLEDPADSDDDVDEDETPDPDAEEDEARNDPDDGDGSTLH